MVPHLRRRDTDVYPSQTGGTNWFSPSFSPRTGLSYVNAWEDVHASFRKTDAEFKEGERFTGGAPIATRPGPRTGQVTEKREENGYGVLRAMDPVSGETRWELKMTDVTASGVLTTATNLVFTGGREGFFQALDARTGKMLWRLNAGGEVAMGPMTYAMNGKTAHRVHCGREPVSVWASVSARVQRIRSKDRLPG